MRDDFQLGVKRIIAQRVGYQCSNPTCRAKTTGPQIDPAKAVNIGVAAHISAASPGGPRYQPAASQDDRKSPENGIWLCQTCAKLIDSDELRFTEVLLRHWKKTAEEHAMRELGRQSPFDREGAPTIEVPLSGQVRFAAPLSGSLTKEAIQRLSTLLPEEVCSAGQIELLGSGRGAMGQQYAIIGAGTNYGWDWTVGLFTAGEFGWERVASIHLEGQKARTPEAVYVPGTPGALVLTHVQGYGTGVFRRSTSWYRIAKGEPSPFLSYPREFHVIGWGLPFGRTLTCTTELMPPELVQGAVLQLRFDAAYTTDDEAAGAGPERELFASSDRLALQWNDTAGVFVPRTASDDFTRIEEIWGEGAEGFGKRNADRLKYLATDGTAKQRSFIREHFGL